MGQKFTYGAEMPKTIWLAEEYKIRHPRHSSKGKIRLHVKLRKLEIALKKFSANININTIHPSKSKST